VDRTVSEEELQEKIGYSFRDKDLLRQALTHRSFANEPEGQGAPHNERLEFLGDAVLGLAVGRLIFDLSDSLNEGELSRIRAEVVSERGLARLGRELGLGQHLRLDRGEERTGGRDKSSLIANALEALLGGILCDGGFEEAFGVVSALFLPLVRKTALRKEWNDNKTRLQELLQARFSRTPEYVLTRTEGPDHRPLYTVEVRFDGTVIGAGSGRSKKAAEQNAAGEALREGKW